MASAREESFETAINAACSLVFQHWAGALSRQGALYVQGDGALRTLSTSAQERMQAVILQNLGGRDREFHRAVFEELIAIRSNRHRGVGLPHTSLQIVSEMMAQLIGPGDRLLDPACGLGGSLVAAAESWERTQIEGIDIDPVVADIAAARLALAGIDAKVRAGNWIAEPPHPTELWDCIVMEPPLGTRATEFLPGGELSWLQKTADSLNDSGRGAVLLGAHAAVRGGESERVRERLLREGRLVGVVELSPRSALQSTAATCLFLVAGSRDPRRDGRILLLSGVGADWQLAQRMVTTCREWMVNAAAPDLAGDRARLVPIEEILDGKNCLPSNYLATKEPNLDYTIPAAATAETGNQLMRELYLENFKSIGEAVKIPLRPLTLIFGKNSAGKSSILQSLLLLKQSIDEKVLNPYGPYARLGSYSSLVHLHETDRDLGIGVTFGAPANVDYQILAPGKTRQIRIDFSWEPTEERAYPQAVHGVLEDRQLQWRLDPHDPNRFELTGDQLGRLAKIDEEHQRSLGHSQINSVYRRLWRTVENAGMSSLLFERTGLLPDRVSHETIETLREYGAATPMEASSSSIELLQRTGNLMSSIDRELRELLQKVTYLGPLREAPTRLSQRSSTDSEIDIPFYLLHNLSERRLVSQYMRGLGMNYELDAVPVTTPTGDSFVGELAGLVLTDTRTGVRLSPSDVGFGVSQVLPILVELAARSDSIIMVEQPEIHLHPAMQAALADVLIESVSRSGRANQVIAETHSENLVLRLQRRVREGVIDADDVAILYVDQDTEGQGMVRHLRLSEHGEFLDEWPHGFFEEQFDELFGEM